MKITIAKPIRKKLSWCLAGEASDFVDCTVPVEVASTVTVGKTWFVSLIPPLPVSSKLFAVPGCTLPDDVVFPAGPTEAWGVCVFAWLSTLPLPPVINNAIDFYCKA